MKFTVERNWIEVIGIMWMPAIDAAQRKDLSSYDMKNIGEPTRENVEQWLAMNTGDFQQVLDFHAIIGEIEIPWANEDSEAVYNDCMCTNED